jgi:YopX protein
MSQTREIKFRIWASGGLMWPNHSLHDKLPVDWEAIMQFTGLKDKNGKEIFEGDIVTYKVGAVKVTGPVWWSVEGAQWAKGDIGQQLSSYQKTTEIIGNIYENPELLVSLN